MSVNLSKFCLIHFKCIIGFNARSRLMIEGPQFHFLIQKPNSNQNNGHTPELNHVCSFTGRF